MELIALEEAKAHAANMTDDNFTDVYLDIDHSERNPDDDAFLNNLRNGFIACVLGNCYFESCLNTLLREKMGYDPEGEVIKGSERIKLEILFNGKEESYDQIRSSVFWRDYHRLKKMRNALVHYKNNCAEDASSYPPLNSWKIGGELLADFFTKTNIETCLSSTETLVSSIAAPFDTAITPHVAALTCNGRFAGCSYLCSSAEAKAILEEYLTSAGE